MANEILGREVPVSMGATVIGVARTKTMTINNEGVDVTADADDGIQRFLAKPGQKAVELSIELMYDPTDAAMLEKVLSDDLLEEFKLDYGTFKISGNFFMATYEQGLSYNEAATVTLSLSSSGAIVKAA